MACTQFARPEWLAMLVRVMGEPYYRPDRGTWAVAYKDLATGKRRQITFKGEDAEGNARAFWKAHRSREQALRTGAVTLDQVQVSAHGSEPISTVADKWRDEMKAEKLSEAHVKTQRRTLERLFESRGMTLVRHFTEADVLAWMKTGGYESRTAAAYMKTFRAFGRWLVRNHYVIVSPVEHTKRPGGRIKTTIKHRALTAEEVSRLVNCAEVKPHRRLFYSIGLRIGLRKTEQSRLTWDQIDFDAGTVAMTRDKGKVDRDDVLPIPRMLLEQLRVVRQAPAKTVLDTTPTLRTFRRDCERAGIDTKYVNLRSLRKTLNTILAAEGVDVTQRQKIMRHSDPRLTQGAYLDAEKLGLRDAMEKMDGKPNKESDVAS